MRCLRSSVFLGLITALGCAFPARQPLKQPPGAAVRDQPLPARGQLEHPRHRILVLPFLDEKISRGDQILRQARSALVSQLNATGRFVIVRVSDFPYELEKYKTEDNDYDLEKLSKEAQKIGVAAVVEGKVLSIQAKRLGDSVGLFRNVTALIEAQVRIRTAATRNGRLILEERRTAKVEASTTSFAERNFSDRHLEQDPQLVRQAVTRAVSSSVPQVLRAVEKLAWEGRVALVNGEKIYLNAGRLSGLQVGDILKISEEGQEIFDPDTGLFIGRAPGRMKGTVEVVSYFGKDGAIAIVHSGSGFQENDQVELY